MKDVGRSSRLYGGGGSRISEGKGKLNSGSNAIFITLKIGRWTLKTLDQ